MDDKSSVFDKGNTDILGKMTVTDIVEHEDGSATVMFNMSPEIRDALLAYGLKLAILIGIEIDNGSD